MARVFIGVGSNEGDRLWNISRAIQALSQTSGVGVANMATIIETKPEGGPVQGPYLNTVVEVETSLDPDSLLEILQNIERLLGRVPCAIRWSARPIDLDLLLYDDRVIQQPRLIVPHPRMHLRIFVLEPLAQLAPDFLHPVLRQPISALAEAVARVSDSCSFVLQSSGENS